MSDEERDSDPGDLIDGDTADDGEEPKRQGPKGEGERDDDPDHGYGQLAP